jgi:hypothetical protein
MLRFFFGRVFKSYYALERKTKNDRYIKLICIELSSSWLCISIIEQMKNKKYHTQNNCKIKIVERGKTDTPSTQIHDRSFALFNTGT